MTPLTILVASLVILIVDSLAERYFRERKHSVQEGEQGEPIFDWLSNPLRRH